jgi:hypothetical protein
LSGCGLAWLLALRWFSTAVVCDAALQGIHQVDNVFAFGRAFAAIGLQLRFRAKLTHLLRKAAARSAETICVTIGEILRTFTATECANYFRNSAYARS